MKTIGATFFLATVAVLASGILFWAVGQRGPVFVRTAPPDYFSEFTASLAAGHLYFPATPDPRLRALADPWDRAQRENIPTPSDLSYYQGRYYLYFGVVPFALLFLPWLLATGHALGGPAAVWLFGTAGLWSQLSVLWRLRRRSEPFGYLFFGLAAMALLAGSQILFLCWIPGIFEVEIAAAYAFTSAAIAAVTFAWQSPGRRYPWLAVASACAGLAVGCRPNCVFGAGALWAGSLFLGWRGFPRGERMKLAASLTLPLAFVLALLFSYNAARFGRPLEFGFRYQLENIDRTRIGFFSPHYLGFNLREYLLARPRLGQYFPFVLDSADVAMALPLHYEGTQDVYGWLWTVPLLGLLPVSFLSRRQPPAAAQAAIGVALAVGAANLASLCGLNFAMYRYAVDAVPSLELAAIVLLLGWADWSRGRGLAGWALRAALAGLLAWTVVVSGGASFKSYQDVHRVEPKAFVHDSSEAIARFANEPVFLFDRLFRVEATVPRLTIRLPQNRWGRDEPLLVTGDYPQQDFLYLYYSDPAHVWVGVEAMGLGGPVSPPIPIDYSRPHTVDIILGSGLPPPGHPLYAGLTPAAAAQFRRSLVIRIDGRPVLDTAKDLHATRDRWRWGESPFDPAFGTRFTGQILRIEQIPAGTFLPKQIH